MKIFIFDLDGTLIAKGGSTPLASSIEGLKMIKEHHDLVCIATGRCIYMVPESIRTYTDYIIASNGQVVASKDELIYENYLTNEQVETLERVYHKYHTTYNYKRVDAYHIFGDFERAYNLELKYNKDFGAFLIRGKNIDKVYTSFLYEENEEIVKKIKEEINAVNLDLYRSVEYTYDVNDRSISKANGLNYLKSIIPNLVSYGFGDGENDYELLKNVDFHYVLGDGNPSLISKMDNIIGPSTSDAIFKAIKDVYDKDC